MLLVLCRRSSMRPHVCCIPSSSAVSRFLNLGSCMIASPCTCTTHFKFTAAVLMSSPAPKDATQKWPREVSKAGADV